MLDLNLIREDAKAVTEKLKKRNYEVDFTELLLWDKERRELLVKVENMKAERNRTTEEISRLKKEGQNAEEKVSEMKRLGDEIKQLDEKEGALDEKIKDFIARLPNIPADDVIAGGKENNKMISTYKERPNFSFKIKDHVELATTLGLIDYERGVKMAGAGFWAYIGTGAILEWALLNYFVETHIKDGYEFILPPHILSYESGFTAGQFPKFIDDVFKVESEEDTVRFLLPTAETALINFHRNEILDEEDLPKKYFSYTPCYRKEAGSYRKEERGMIRGHQFNKVEMFQYTTPETSDAALEELIKKAEDLVRGLGLHFQTSKLAAEDCSASMAKTYDIEVWIPSMEIYKEVSSSSNAKDYQARRGNMKFRRKTDKKVEYIHTLNASGLATSRIIPAILEQYQQEDGSVIVPEVLRKWVGVDVLKPKK